MSSSVLNVNQINGVAIDCKSIKILKNEIRNDPQFQNFIRDFMNTPSYHKNINNGKIYYMKETDYDTLINKYTTIQQNIGTVMSNPSTINPPPVLPPLPKAKSPPLPKAKSPPVLPPLPKSPLPKSPSPKSPSPKTSLTVNIISWNLCYGCIGNNLLDKSAAPLPQQCTDKTTDKSNPRQFHCFQNIIENLKKIKSDNKDNIDIYAFQEATDDKEQIKIFQTVFPKDEYKCHKTKGGSEIILTFFNKIKYNSKIIFSGEGLTVVNRRFHVLEVKNKKETKLFYFINTHLPHKDTNIIEIQNTLKGNLPEDIPIIIAGDLNDHPPSRLDYWKGSLKINGKTLSAKEEPPPTCCSTDLSRPPSSYGDYIISTNGKTTTNKPVPIIPGKITSDHLPVFGTVIL